MDLEKALEQIEKPHNPWDKDLVAIRVVLKHLLEKSKAPVIQDEPELIIKKSKKKG